MTNLEGKLVEKKDVVKTMMTDVESNESIKRETSVSELDITLTYKLYHQDHSGYDTANESLTDLLVTHFTISHCKIFIGLCNKMAKEDLEDASISIAVTDAIDKHSNV